MYGTTRCECLTLNRVIWWIINAQHTGWSLGDSSSSKWKKNSYCTVETTALACLSFSSLAQRQREKTKKKNNFLQSLFLPLPLLRSGVKNKESFVWFSLFLAGARGQTLPGSHRETAHAVWSCNADNTAQPEISLSRTHNDDLSEKIPPCWFKGQSWGQSCLCPESVHQLNESSYLRQWAEAAVTHRERLFGQHNSLNLWYFCCFLLIGPVLSGQTKPCPKHCFWRLLYSLNQMIWISNAENPAFRFWNTYSL